MQVQSAAVVVGADAIIEFESCKLDQIQIPRFYCFHVESVHLNTKMASPKRDREPDAETESKVAQKKKKVKAPTAAETATIVKIFDAFYYNAYGFQCSGCFTPKKQQPHLIVGWVFPVVDASVTDYDEKEAKGEAKLKELNDLLKRTYDSKAFVDDWLGRNFIQIHWTLYSRIPEIINCVLQQQCNLQLMRSEVYYKAGEVFDPLQVEARLIASTRKNLETIGDRLFLIGVGTNLHDRWIWHTAEGKAFCEELRVKYPSYINEKGDKYNLFLWEGVEKICTKFKLLHHCPEWWFGPRLV